LDRTNVAQYAYGLAALGRQLHAMGLTNIPKVDPDSTIAAALMDMYQSMGDALAQQYGGSAAHNTVCSFLHGLKLLFMFLFCSSWGWNSICTISLISNCRTSLD
jgi:hypothetical protein